MITSISLLVNRNSQATSANLHIEKIRVAWLGEGARVLRNWLALALSVTATAARAAHVRLKGPSLLFVCHFVIVVGAGVGLDEQRETRERPWSREPRGRAGKGK
jgi:hypothetical protein